MAIMAVIASRALFGTATRDIGWAIGTTFLVEIACFSQHPTGWQAIIWGTWAIAMLVAVFANHTVAPTPAQRRGHGNPTPQPTRLDVYDEAYTAALQRGMSDQAATAYAQYATDHYHAPARGPWRCHPVVPLLRIPILWRGIEYSDDGRIRVTSPFRNDPTYLPGIKEIAFSGWFQEVILGVGYIDVFYSPWMEGKDRPLSRRIYIPGWFIREHRDHMERRGYHIG